MCYRMLRRDLHIQGDGEEVERIPGESGICGAHSCFSREVSQVVLTSRPIPEFYESI